LPFGWLAFFRKVEDSLGLVKFESVSGGRRACVSFKLTRGLIVWCSVCWDYRHAGVHAYRNTRTPLQVKLDRRNLSRNFDLFQTSAPRIQINGTKTTYPLLFCRRHRCCLHILYVVSSLVRETAKDREREGEIDDRLRETACDSGRQRWKVRDIQTQRERK